MVTFANVGIWAAKDPRMRGDDGIAPNSACQSHFADFFTRSFAGRTPLVFPVNPGPN